MYPRALQFIPFNEIEVFTTIRDIVVRIPDISFTRSDGVAMPISCHLLTRALAFVLPTLQVRDGFVGGTSYEHSWLITASKNIIDPYPMAGVGGPIMYDDIPLWKMFYGPECCFLEHRAEEFRSWERTLNKVVEKIYNDLKNK